MVYSGKVLQGYNEGKVSSLCHTVSALKFSPHVAKPSETGTLFVCLFVCLFICLLRAAPMGMGEATI